MLLWNEPTCNFCPYPLSYPLCSLHIMSSVNKSDVTLLGFLCHYLPTNIRRIKQDHIEDQMHRAWVTGFAITPGLNWAFIKLLQGCCLMGGTTHCTTNKTEYSTAVPYVLEEVGESLRNRAACVKTCCYQRCWGYKPKLMSVSAQCVIERNRK